MKRKSVLNIFLASFVSVPCISGCFFDIDDHRLRLFNDTNINYYLQLKHDSVLTIKDVSFIQDKHADCISKAGDTTWPLFARLNQGGYINMINNYCVDSTMFLYLFRMDTVKKIGWEATVAKQQVFAKKGFRVKDLDSLKWIINLSQVNSRKQQ